MDLLWDRKTKIVKPKLSPITMEHTMHWNDVLLRIINPKRNSPSNVSGIHWAQLLLSKFEQDMKLTSHQAVLLHQQCILSFLSQSQICYLFLRQMQCGRVSVIATFIFFQCDVISGSEYVIWASFALLCNLNSVSSSWSFLSQPIQNCLSYDAIPQYMSI